MIPLPILEQIPLFWIILAVLGGLLLLAVIAVIMYRTGCFTKKPTSDYHVDVQYQVNHTLFIYLFLMIFLYPEPN